MIKSLGRTVLGAGAITGGYLLYPKGKFYYEYF